MATRDYTFDELHANIKYGTPLPSLEEPKVEKPVKPAKAKKVKSAPAPKRKGTIKGWLFRKTAWLAAIGAVAGYGYGTADQMIEAGEVSTEIAKDWKGAYAESYQDLVVPASKWAFNTIASQFNDAGEETQATAQVDTPAPTVEAPAPAPAPKKATLPALTPSGA